MNSIWYDDAGRGQTAAFTEQAQNIQWSNTVIK